MLKNISIFVILLSISLFFIVFKKDNLDNEFNIKRLNISSNEETKHYNLQIQNSKFRQKPFISEDLQNSKLMQFKENSEKSRLKIERFKDIKNELLEKQNRVRFMKRLAFRQYRNIGQTNFSVPSSQKQYLYKQKQREAKKKMIEKIQGKNYE
jgi:hypothetical protein